MQHTRPDRQTTCFRWIAPSAIAVTLVFTTGCNEPLGRVDRKTEVLLAERSEILGSSRRSHSVENRAGIGSAGSGGLYDTSPETENPSVEELRFVPAASEMADREIADRLDAYSSHAAGVGADPDGEAAITPIMLTIEDAFRAAENTGREFLRNQEDYILAAIRLLQERHLWGPRFFNDTSFILSGAGDDGRFEHATDIINTLRASQRLPYGGSVEARWIVNATDQLRDRVTGGYRQSSQVALGANLPLLRGAGRVAREDLIQSERNLIYQARSFERSRRALLVDIARDYFDLLEQQSRIGNQIRQIEGLERLAASTTAKVEAGRLRPFQQDLAENQVLSARASLAGLRERYILALDRFKVRLGLDVDTPIDVAPLQLELPAPAISQELAAEAALRYRLDLQNTRDRLDDSRRDVKIARNQLLPDLDLDGSLGIPTDNDDPTGGLDIDGEELDYSLGVTLSLPLDREIERLNLRAQLIGLEQAIRDYDEFRDGVIIDARSSIRNIDLARFQLRLAERQVEINMRRLEDLELRDDTDPQSVVDAQAELVAAENARDQARTDLRTAVLDYLLSTGQLRVAADGTFEAPDGIESAPVPASELDPVDPLADPLP